MDMSIKETLALLSFVCPAADPHLRMWLPTSTGDAQLDSTMGKNYADELVVAMADGDNPGLFIQVMKAMARHGFGPMEISFCSRIAEYAIRTERDIIPIKGNVIQFPQIRPAISRQEA